MTARTLHAAAVDFWRSLRNRHSTWCDTESQEMTVNRLLIKERKHFFERNCPNRMGNVEDEEKKSVYVY